MSVDAFVTKVGLKMVSTVHSRTSVQGKVSLTEEKSLNVEFDLPEEQMDIFSVKYVPMIYLAFTRFFFHFPQDKSYQGKLCYIPKNRTKIFKPFQNRSIINYFPSYHMCVSFSCFSFTCYYDTEHYNEMLLLSGPLSSLFIEIWNANKK